MKKVISFFTVIVILAAFCGFPFKTAFAADEKAVVFADDVKNGVYSIEVTSSSSMFRIVNAELTVNDGTMTAVITLSGKGYGKLFMGTGEEALKASESEFIAFSENSEGEYTYEVPVEALNKELNCAAWSTKKSQWYDRVIVFEADTLPKGAVKSDTVLYIVIAAGFVCLIFISVSGAVIIRRRKTFD